MRSGDEQIELARRRCAAPHLARRDRALGEEDDRAAGLGFGVRPVPDAHARDVGDHSVLPAVDREARGR